MRLFEELCIETVGSCNRYCPTCLRQSLPDKEMLEGRFGKQQRLGDDLFYSIIDQAVDMGFTGRINLQYYNEPIQDPRLAKFGRYIKDKGVFSKLQFHTNGDLIFERKAAELDGIFDEITVALYDEAGGKPMPQPQRSGRESQLRSWFKHSSVTFTGGDHIMTHFSILPRLAEQIAFARTRPCITDTQVRMIIDFRGEMLLCCEDFGGWSLGNIATTPLKDLWFGEKHTKIVETLSVPGGREAYEYCRICPRVF